MWKKEAKFYFLYKCSQNILCTILENHVPLTDEWWTKLKDFAEMDKLTINSQQDKTIKVFMNNWNFFQKREKNGLMNFGFEDQL